VKIGLPAEADKLFSFELELKVSPTPHRQSRSEEVTRLEPHASRRTDFRERQAGDTMRSRRKRTLLSFQRPVPLAVAA
jgi:hypothetical protein